MRRTLMVLLAASAMVATPAFADPAIKTAMPAIRASLSGEEMVVRMDQGVLGASRSLAPRTLTIVARDASGAVVYETKTAVSRRMTYARVPAATALKTASTVMVTVR
jgi:hypothetical protein